jgi:U3 small nucleolar ribonucleoprotein protein IMP4
MLRRNARLRKEFVYRKSLEGKERLLYEKKRKIRECLEEGKPIPTELKREEELLRKEVELEDINTREYGNLEKGVNDDEYKNAPEAKILLTTSRDASSRLLQFCKELKLLFPTSSRINRGSGTEVSALYKTEAIDCSRLSTSSVRFSPLVRFYTRRR